MNRLFEALRAHTWCTLAVLLVALLAFFGGRWTAPERVRVEERVEWKDRIEYKERVVEKRVEGPVRIRTVIREIPPLPGSPCPDRPLVETERVEEHGPVVVDRASEGEAHVVREVVRERIEVPAPPPQWRAGALVGVDLGALVVGAHVERRVLGPLSLGAFALVPLAHPLAPAVGASLSAEW